MNGPAMWEEKAERIHVSILSFRAGSTEHDVLELPVH